MHKQDLEYLITMSGLLLDGHIKDGDAQITISYYENVIKALNENLARTVAGDSQLPNTTQFAKYYLSVTYGDGDWYRLAPFSWPTGVRVTDEIEQLWLASWGPLMDLETRDVKSLSFRVVLSEDQPDQIQWLDYMLTERLSDGAWQAWKRRIIKDLVKRHNRPLEVTV